MGPGHIEKKCVKDKLLQADKIHNLKVQYSTYTFVRMFLHTCYCLPVIYLPQ